MNKKNKKYPLFYVSPGPEVARAAGNDDHEPGLNFDDIDSDGGFDFVVFFFTEFLLTSVRNLTLSAGCSITSSTHSTEVIIALHTILSAEYKLEIVFRF